MTTTFLIAKILISRGFKPIQRGTMGVGEEIVVLSIIRGGAL
jgi:hypothetical protein